MKVTSFKSKYLSQAKNLLNAHLQLLPFAPLLNNSQVDQLINDVSPWATHYSEFQARSNYESICIVDNDDLHAIAQVNINQHINGEKTENDFHVSWMVAKDHNYDATSLLLDEIINIAKQSGYPQVNIQGRFEASYGWFGIPTIWSHIIDAIERKNFAEIPSWILMHNKLENIPKANIPNEINVSLEWNIKEEAEEWDLILMIDSIEAGECSIWSLPIIQNSVAILEWIGVDPIHRNMGLGAYLLYSQREFHLKRGVKHFGLQTEVDNVTARSFFESMNFQYGPECKCYKKPLV